MGNTSQVLADRVTSQTVELNGIPISLTKLSELSGFTISHISRIFSGTANGSMEANLTLARLLNMSVEELREAIPRTNKSLARRT